MSKQISPVKKAILIGGMCSLSYLAVYVARNILGVVSPQLEAEGVFTKEGIGTLSSVYFTTYACGQLINGLIGDKIKSKYMISFGLMLAGVCNFLLPLLTGNPIAPFVAYGATGFFLSMIYAPMTKVVAENTEPIYATRCSLGYTLASFLGSPLAGVLAAVLAWQGVFAASSITLITMGSICFAVFTMFERKKIIEYGKYAAPKTGKGSIGILIRHRIIKFTGISILTGVVRTAVVFWLTSYFAEFLNMGEEKAALTYTGATLVLSCAVFVSVFLYERLKRNMDLTILISFSVSMLSFVAAFLFRNPVLNVGIIVLAILSCNCAASMMWSRYCPSLRDTGMVSAATGYLDFVSYMAASISSSLFANAVSGIGWGNLILVWAGLMGVGVVISLPYGKWKAKA